MEEWERGLAFPQASWKEGFFWVAEQAPMLRMEIFQTFIRQHLPNTASRWDAAAEAEAEFGFAASPEEIAALHSARERIAAEKAAYEAEQAERRANSPFAALAALQKRN